MKVILQKDVKDLGKAGDLLKVADGYARNYLFPRQLAMAATEGQVKQWGHIQRVAESNRKKASKDRGDLISKLETLTVDFKMPAGETDKLFGSVTNMDISNRLQDLGYSVDKRDIHLEEPIKLLGQHKATIKLGEGLETQVAISVDRA